MASGFLSSGLDMLVPVYGSILGASLVGSLGPLGKEAQTTGKRMLNWFDHLNFLVPM